MKRREITEVCFEIKKEIVDFNKEQFLEYIKWAIPRLYNSLVNEQKIDIKCKKELIMKLKEENEKYHITKDMDHINIQYAELFDDIKEENEFYIKVYATVYFYDDAKNNIDNNDGHDKYWNDIWLVTCKNTRYEKKNSNCSNCDAVMEYNKVKDMFVCKYCGNTIQKQLDSNWEFVDIELSE